MPRFPTPSPAVASMPASPYSTLAERAARSGRPIRPFHVGDTWREPPIGARMEEIGAVPGRFRYGPVRGLPPLVDAIVERTRARTGEAVVPDQVLLTGGATAGLAAVVGALVAPGDEVLLVAPYWPLIAGTVRTFSGIPVPVPLLHAGVPDKQEAVAALARALTPRTVALYFNTPNNPTGRILPPELLEAFAAFAYDHGLWVLADEVYEDIRFGDAGHQPFRPLLPDRTFAAYSFSKAYGMAGNRVGHVVGPRGAMAEVAKVGVYTVYSAPTVSQVAALAALSPSGDAWQREAIASYAEVGTEAAARLGVDAPSGSTFLFVDVADHLDERRIEGFLTDCADEGVLLAPGSSFGPFPTFVRMCYTAVPPDETRAGVATLARRLGR